MRDGVVRCPYLPVRDFSVEECGGFDGGGAGSKLILRPRQSLWNQQVPSSECLLLSACLFIGLTAALHMGMACGGGVPDVLNIVYRVYVNRAKESWVADYECNAKGCTTARRLYSTIILHSLTSKETKILPQC